MTRVGIHKMQIDSDWHSLKNKDNAFGKQIKLQNGKSSTPIPVRPLLMNGSKLALIRVLECRVVLSFGILFLE